MQIWKSYEIEQGKPYHWTIGPLDLWIEKNEFEWCTAAGEGESETDQCADNQGKPEDQEWERWSADKSLETIKLTPVLPDRPLIVRPVSKLEILPNQEGRFFVNVPLWIRLILCSGKKKETILTEYSSITLSNSWFGTPMEGELCYAMRTRARRSVDEIEKKPYRAVCPIIIKNRSDQTLEFERLCLRTSALSVYQGDTYMWTNEGKYVYRGPLQYSDVSFTEKAPDYDNAKKEIGIPREDAEGIVQRSFANLKSFTFG